jgi:hypothetical protein
MSKKTRTKNVSVGQRKSAKNGGLDGVDLRQEMMWELFTDRRSDTWNNATKSALKAGYAQSTAENITRETWFRNKIQQLSQLLPKAEDILWQDLNMNVSENINLRRIRSATAIFICETVGKNKYTKKVETENNTHINLIEGNPHFDSLFRQAKRSTIAQEV